MAGTIIVSNLKTDTDNSFIVRSNTGATLFSCNTSGLDVANTIPAGSITSSKIASVSNTAITGLVTAAQIASLANTQITGTLIASQIASINASTATSGTLPAARLPTGSVLQVVQAEYSTPTSTTSGTFTDSGLTASITPISSTSKILVLVNQQIRVNKSGVADTGYGLRILRGVTAIFSRDDSATAQYYTTQAGTSADLRFQNTMVYLDSPATTSSTTYKTQINSFNTSTVAAQHGSQPSTITLMEIAV